MPNTRRLQVARMGADHGRAQAAAETGRVNADAVKDPDRQTKGHKHGLHEITEIKYIVDHIRILLNDPSKAL